MFNFIAVLGKSKKYFLKLVVSIFISLSSSFVFACNSADHCVRVGTWNIAWLGGDKREQASDVNTINTMAEMIANQWSIDLIALQEINTSIDGRYRGGLYSTKPWIALKKALEKRGYQTAVGESGQGQRIVLAWRNPVALDNVVEELNVPDSYKVDELCHSAYLRRPLSGRFHAEHFDFWLVALHLKSGFGNHGHCSDDVRSLQSYYLAGQLKDLQKIDKDIVVLGDFNAVAKNKSLEALQSFGLDALTDKEDRNQASNNRSQGRGKNGKILDHIMIAKIDTGEWIKKSTVIFKPQDQEAFTERYSDHFPVWADFDTQKSNH